MAEALRLADELDDIHTTHVARNAAAELRRQHGEIKSMRAERLRSERRLLDVKAQRDALLEALKTYGWHTEDCPQYPTYARPKNWPACTCGYDAAIALIEGRVKAVEEGK